MRFLSLLHLSSQCAFGDGVCQLLIQQFFTLSASLKLQQNLMFSCIHFPIWPFPLEIMIWFDFILYGLTGIYIYVYIHTPAWPHYMRLQFTCTHAHTLEIAPPLSPGWPQEVCVQISGKEFLAFPSPSKLQQLGSKRVESVKEAIGVSDLYTCHIRPGLWGFSSGVRVYVCFCLLVALFLLSRTGDLCAGKI